MRIGSSRRRLCGYSAAMCGSAAVGSAQFLRAPWVDRVVWSISAASFARAEFCPVLRRRYTQFAVLG